MKVVMKTKESGTGVAQEIDSNDKDAKINFFILLNP
jgi:hypothetical protein|tara:strand:- start:345 stop:452 length:108 start_codon:yes stop_codon:yes gene_type:complete